jgi:phospholipid/cholesterol/gamma-HCH transport system substrate-binding protein
LHRAYIGITNNEQKIQETFDGLHRTLRASGNFFERNEPKLNGMVDDLSALGSEARDGLRAARARYVDGAQVQRILNDVERTTAATSQSLGPLLNDSQKLVADAQKLTSALSSDAQLDRYRTITRDLAETAVLAKSAAKDAQTVAGQVRQGKGTLGALAMDEALYDDLQELLRDLKHNPWKFFWRE